LPRRTVFRHLSILTERKYLHADGFKEHGPGCRTRLRRLDLNALQRDRKAASPKPTRSAMRGTSAADPSATHGTDPSAMGGTQTKRDNRERYQVMLTWRPGDRSVHARLRKIIWSEGVQLVAELTDRTERQARGLIGELMKLANNDPDQVVTALQQAVTTRPVDTSAYLLKACKAPERRPRVESRAMRITRRLDEAVRARAEAEAVRGSSIPDIDGVALH
jgi:hypothetical protein